MALVLADRVRETTTTVGTGSVVLGGAVTGYQSFSVVGNGNTTYYCIAGQGTAEWEVGIGTYTSSGTTLARTTVLASSNSGSLVNFSAGTKDVFVTYPSEKSVNLDASGLLSAPAGLGTGVPTALNTAVGSAGAFVVNGGALGTPSSGTVTNLTGTASININGTVGATTPASGAFTSLSDSGNLTFTGTGNRITGDFSNATLVNRVMFQTSTVNGASVLGVIPNGTGTTTGLVLGNNSDPTNWGFLALNGTATDARVTSGVSGTGTYLPMTFYTGGSERMRVDTSGNLLLGTNTAFTSTNVAGSMAVNGYGIYPYTTAAGATNSTVATGLLYQNATPYAGDNGATASTFIGTISFAKLSNSGAGGSNTITGQGVNGSLSISNVGTTARISAIGGVFSAARNTSTDVSTNANNVLNGISASATHGISSGAGIVSGSVYGGTFAGTNNNGTTTTIAGVASSVSVASATNALTSSASSAIGLYNSGLFVGAATGGPATVSGAYGIYASGVNVGATGTVTNYYGLYLESSTVTGTLTNRWGVYQNDSASNNYFAGNIGIGTSSPSSKLSVSDGTVRIDLSPFVNTGYLGTQSNHPVAFITNNTERMRIDTSGNLGIGNTPSGTYKLEVSGKSSATEVYATNGLVLNAMTISTSTTIPSGYSASSVGPISVANGVTVTVANGSRWVTL